MALRDCKRALLVLTAAALVSGCSMFRSSDTGQVSAPTAEQQRWWEENRSRARFVPGRGYYVDGHSGYFDDRGRPMSDSTSSGFIDDSEEVEYPIISELTPSKNIKRFKKLIGRGPNEPLARKAYADGESFFRQAKYAEAAKKFKVAYDRWPDSPLEEDALFMCAESNFFADKYVDASDTYELLIKKYSGTQYLDKISVRRFAIARYWEQYEQAHPDWLLTPNLVDNKRPLFDTNGHAMRAYDKIRIDDPTGPLADDSIMATANAYFVAGRYEDADYYYSLLRSEYPKSEHQFKAHLLGLRSKINKYQGPDYQGTPLEEAIELADQLLAQFPNELGAEREKIVQAKGEVRAQLAQRDWIMAQYYDNSEFYTASRLYYEKIVKDYPDTRLAQAAHDRLGEIKDLPGEPEQKFEWLVELFPESSKNGPTMKSAPSMATAPSDSINR
jgi:outer membrane protein assembly factor BamD (BamD/ComL family)